MKRAEYPADRDGHPRVGIRLSHEELALFREAAEAAGVPKLSTWIRQVVRLHLGLPGR